MAVYRLINRTFSREWRRSKDYRDHEIKWLAKKRGLAVRNRNRAVEVFDPKRPRHVVVAFKEVDESMPLVVDERIRMFAALRGGYAG